MKMWLHSPIAVTLDGIVTDFNTVDHPPISNMFSPMTVSPEMKDISERKEHLKNAWEPKTTIINKLERVGIVMMS